MRLNVPLLHGAHILVEAVLAALVWVLLSRLHAARKTAMVLQTELGLVKKRFEAATAGFHIRLLQVEKQTKVAAGAAAGAGRSAQVLSLSPQLNRGEYDLMRKVRQLGSELS